MSPEQALEAALLGRLHTEGRCIEANRTAALIERYELARWLRRGTRRHEWVVRDEARLELEAHLESLLPSFNEVFAFLREKGHDPFDPANLLMLGTLRAAVSPAGRTFLNRRNWNAAAGAGPKRQARRSAEGTRITQDWVVRVRFNQGVKLGPAGNEQWAAALSLDGHEVVIPERAFLVGLRFGGALPELVITVENLGSYIDLPLPPCAMAVYSPGKDWRAAVALLGCLPSVPWMHFGDLDPEGLGIAMDVARRSGRPLRLYVPSFAADYLGRAQKHGVDWASAPMVEVDIPVIAQLQELGVGILQEVFVLDERLGRELDQEVPR